MLNGPGLEEWARERATVAAVHDCGTILLGVTWNFVTLAIIAAYLQGGVDVLKDEIERHKP